MTLIIVSVSIFDSQLGGDVITEPQQGLIGMKSQIHSLAAPILFGTGLICAGQASTLINTESGKFVLEGFLSKSNLKPSVRRLVTRSFTIIPALAGLLFFGNSATYHLLIFCQVMLAFQLPFTIIPLIKFTSSSSIMGSFKNSYWIELISWMSIFLIMGFNGYYLLSKCYQFATYSPDAFTLASIFFVPFLVALFTLLIWMIFKSHEISSDTFTSTSSSSSSPSFSFSPPKVSITNNNNDNENGQVILQNSISITIPESLNSSSSSSSSPSFPSSPSSPSISSILPCSSSEQHDISIQV